jgi:hypothetical protein
MPFYLVSVYDNGTWRKTENVRIEAGNIGLASYRVFKQFKKSVKGKRLTDITIKAKKV